MDQDKPALDPDQLRGLITVWRRESESGLDRPPEYYFDQIEAWLAR